MRDGRIRGCGRGRPHFADYWQTPKCPATLESFPAC
jgi:hypothetical protein